MNTKVIKRHLILKDGNILYGSGGNTFWEVLVNEIALIGEYTTNAFDDDYFIILITKTSVRYEASFYTDGIQIFLEELGELLSTKH